jgi:2-polyprenyl-6-methoxyphenol hydroxylase-like FAD-dependent oxidoreductase
MSARRHCRMAAAASSRPSVSGPRCPRSATPIRKIHVSDQGHFGFARIDAAEQGLRAMGYVVPNRALGSALWSRLRHSPDVRVCCPAQVLRVTPGEQFGRAADSAGRRPSPPSKRGSSSRPTARNPRCAVPLAYARKCRDYEQTAVITTVLPQRFHEHVAYERFTDARSTGAVAAGGRPLHARADAWAAHRRNWPCRGPMRSFSPKCNAGSDFDWAASSRPDAGSLIRCR